MKYTTTVRECLKDLERRLGRIEKRMSDLGTEVQAVKDAESAAEVRIAAAEKKAADAQATAEATAKAAQDAAATLQTEIDSIKSGDTANTSALADVVTALNAINADPATPAP